MRERWGNADMITVTRLNGTHVTINAMLIETIEQTPHTVITLTTGNKMVVKESTAELVHRIQAYLQPIGIVVARMNIHSEAT